MKQRLAIAIPCCVTGAHHLDEPTNGLDPAGYKKCGIWSPVWPAKPHHHPLQPFASWVEKVCDRVAIIKEGNVIAVNDASLLGKGQLLQIKVENPQKAIAVLKITIGLKVLPKWRLFAVDAPKKIRAYSKFCGNNIFISELSVKAPTWKCISGITGGNNNEQIIKPKSLNWKNATWHGCDVRFDCGIFL